MTEDLNYEEYGYPENAKIEITPELFSFFSEFVNEYGQKEAFIAFEQKEKLEDTLSDKNKAKHVITPKGLQLMAVAMELNNIHEENCRKGIAIHRDELEKPKISLAKD